jgi:hypothetical protein
LPKLKKAVTSGSFRTSAVLNLLMMRPGGDDAFKLQTEKILLFKQENGFKRFGLGVKPCPPRPQPCDM